MSGSTANTMTLEAVRAAVARLPAEDDFVWDGADEDDRPASEAEMRAAVEADLAGRAGRAGSRRTPVVLGIDTDIVAAFRATGPGWRGRMNAALREWVREHG
ncbi:BrnA antitoxin family protein [uncultured Rhodospira sp.]|uniref:BrnA antitoxin family protein n=1 Tax=uncultured Rhodospira sp. TaxID=1936189 RepID=UPI00260644C6|nr:BrnA antitoxin family protein [uncultured Rhodospira sp.]